VVIEIRDLTGRMMKQFTVKTIQTERISLDVSGLSPNMYLLKATGDGTSYSGKFQIVR
jgi:hypothetical protein